MLGNARGLEVLFCALVRTAAMIAQDDAVDWLLYAAGGSQHEAPVDERGSAPYSPPTNQDPGLPGPAVRLHLPTPVYFISLCVDMRVTCKQ